MPFTTLQLLHRLSRKTKCGGRIGALAGAERLELVDAANAGLAAFASLLPQTRRESPASGVLRPPLSLTLDILNAATGFSYTGGAPFPAGGYTEEDDLVGHSIVLTGDPRVNRLQRAGELLSAYLGTDASSLHATAYGDCIQMGQDERRLLGRPIYSDGACDRQLVPLSDPFKRWTQYPFINLGGTLAQLEQGTPEYYWTEPLLGAERSSSPVWLLRVWPLPAVTATLTYRLESLPAAIVLEDFTTARDLPVEDREILHVVALAAEHIPGALLAPEVSSTELATAAQRARAAFGDHPQTRDSRPRRLTTRRGW